MEFYDREGNEITLPMHKEVCPTCNGSGTHVNPSIDGNGLSDEFAADYEFMEDYRAGYYDVRCEECDGRNVIDVVDEERLNEEQRQAFEDWCDYQNELAWERKMAERGYQW